jgi:hypothetical protein
MMNMNEQTTDNPRNAPIPASLPAEKGPPVVRRSRWRRWARWALVPLLIAAFLLGVASILYYVQHRASVNRLEEATANQDALHPGWRLEDIEAARAEVPDEQNSGHIVR